MPELKLEERLRSQENLSSPERAGASNDAGWQRATPIAGVPERAGPPSGTPFAGMYDEAPQIAGHRGPIAGAGPGPTSMGYSDPVVSTPAPVDTHYVDTLSTSEPAPRTNDGYLGETNTDQVLSSSLNMAPGYLAPTMDSAPRTSDGYIGSTDTNGVLASTNTATGYLAPTSNGALHSYGTPTTNAPRYGYGEEAKLVPSAPPSLVSTAANGLRIKEKDDIYKNEKSDASLFRGPGSNWSHAVQAENKNAPALSTVATHYMSPDEAKQSEVAFEKGKLKDASGQALDTSKASGIGTQLRQAEGKHIFVMTKDGDIRQADPWANKKVEQRSTGGHLGFVNHSSFVDGEGVAGAGELKVNNGSLEQLSDNSGHYQPDGKMTAQTIDQLEKKGVDVGNVDLKLVGKEKGQGPVYMSTDEFRSHADPMTAEKEIRAQKEKLRNGVFDAVLDRQTRTGVNMMRPHDAK